MKEDDQPSCSAIEALMRQEPFINQNLAYQALGMLTQLLRHGCISYHGGFCNLSTGWLTPLPIRVPTACPHRD
jgi:sulfur-carrier protein adenylyltransferase/sulfurtransferase